MLVNGQIAQVLNGQGQWSFQNISGDQVTLIPRGAVWRYLDDGSDQGVAWRGPGYDDAAWKSGPGQLGYGDDPADEVTVLGYGGNANDKFPTSYFRSTFQIDDPADILALNLELLYDDGAAVYINGVEAVRTQLAADAGYRSYSTGSPLPAKRRTCTIRLSCRPPPCSHWYAGAKTKSPSRSTRTVPPARTSASTCG